MRARRFLAQDVARTVGLSADEMREAPIAPPVKRFAEFIARVGLNAGAGEAALPARTDFLLWRNTCAPPAEALRKVSRAPGEVVAHLEQYAEVPPEVEDGAVDVIDFGLRTGGHEPTPPAGRQPVDPDASPVPRDESARNPLTRVSGSGRSAHLTRRKGPQAAGEVASRGREGSRSLGALPS
ncbi:hypothetical protein [Saccharothrix obliqua]|uniref:hypothetical protein n=1 Tax=Saccharothrix obliqua TaxID=2861747 RepID=UPI001C5F0554|nr:hypothetical protein [Saccharothrix obliqua]MBW4721539.1 hypothetical protein [Saccharothrix obliqua]